MSLSYTIYDALLGATTLRQCTAGEFTANARPIVARTSGGVSPAEIYGGETAPMGSFESEDLGTLLAISNFLQSGIVVSSSTLAMVLQQRAQGGTYQSGSNHFAATAANGLVVPTRIQIPEKGNCSIGLDAHFRGTSSLTNPVSFNVAAALASTLFNGCYAFAGIDFNNGTLITRGTGVTVNPGIQVLAEGFNGGNYPTSLSIQERNPTIDVSFDNAANLANFASAFTAMTSLVVYLRKRSGAGWVADEEEEHIAISFADGMTTFETIRASGRDSSVGTLRFHGEALSASAVSAIPA